MRSRTYAMFPLWFAVVFLAANGPSQVINGHFEDNGVEFSYPFGWTPFGEAGFGSSWETSWFAQVFNIAPRREAGLYQVVPAAIGARYRLQARVRSGIDQVQVRIGLIPTASVQLEAAVWAEPHNANFWLTQTVEAVAQADTMTIVLHARNTNQEHVLLQRAGFDAVVLTPLAAGPTPTAAAPPPPPTLASPRDVLGCLANLWTLAEPKPGVRTYLASTHDPSGGNVDFDRYEGVIDDGGEPWVVLKTLQGPGTIVRFWTTNWVQGERIRIYVDGARVVDCSLKEFFDSCGSFAWPLVNRNSGAWASYVPIPFRQSARIQLRYAPQDRLYWQITYQRFDSDNDVRPLTHPPSAEDAALLRLVQDQWGLASRNPKPELPNTYEAAGTVSVSAGATATIWSTSGAGTVDALRLRLPNPSEALLRDLRLVCVWDQQPDPQVDAPLGLFFGVGYGPTVSRGLLMGMSPPTGAYCYFPMPFAASARVELHNHGGAPIHDVAYVVRWATLEPAAVGPLRFHTRYARDPAAGQGKLYEPFTVAGRGHFVGASHALGRGNGSDFHYLEGDEYIWVDGENVPSTAGTGTEDYFNCGWYFFNGAISLAAYGATEVKSNQRVGVYRLHLPDWVPFDRSFRFALEVGDAPNSPESGDYASVGYFYLAAPEPVDPSSLLRME